MNKEEKANSYLPLMLGFFSLFVPYNAYGEVSVFSSVELFALPLCYIFLTLIMRNLLLIGSILSIIVALQTQKARCYAKFGIGARKKLSYLRRCWEGIKMSEQIYAGTAQYNLI